MAEKMNLKQNIKRLLRLPVLFVLILLVSVGFSGCTKATVSLTTTLTMEADGTGTRVMKMSLSKKAYKKLFNGISIDTLGIGLRDSCPEQMEYAYADDGKTYSFTFTLPFSGIDDYSERAGAIIGETAEILYEEPESVFTTGVHYEENFSTMDLIGWVEGPMNTLTDGKVILTKYLQDDGWTMLYNEREFTGSSGPIVVETLLETPVERVDILSLYKQNQTCNRQVIFTFTNESMKKNGTAIRQYVEEAIPENAVANWEEGSDNTTCTVLENDMSADELDSFMKVLFHSEKTGVTDREFESSNIFDSDFSRSEYIDLSAFTYDTSTTVALGVYVQWESGMEVSVTNSSGDAYDLKKSTVYGGYYKVLDASVSKATFISNITSDYIIGDIEVNTVFRKSDNVTRTVNLVFAENPSEGKLEQIRQKLASKAETYAEVTADTAREDGKSAIVITQNGSVVFINDGFAKIYGTTGQLSYSNSGKLLAFKHAGSFSDVIDFSNFIKNDSYLTTVHYNLTLLSGESIVDNSVSSTISLNDGDETVNGNKYSGSLTGGFFSITLQSEVWNTDGVMLFVLILGFILVVIIVLLAARGLSMFLGRDGTPSHNSTGADDGNGQKGGKKAWRASRGSGRYVINETVSFGDPDEDNNTVTRNREDTLPKDSDYENVTSKKAARNNKKKLFSGFVEESTTHFPQNADADEEFENSADYSELGRGRKVSVDDPEFQFADDFTDDDEFDGEEFMSDEAGDDPDVKVPVDNGPLDIPTGTRTGADNQKYEDSIGGNADVDGFADDPADGVARLAEDGRFSYSFDDETAEDDFDDSEDPYDPYDA